MTILGCSTTEQTQILMTEPNDESPCTIWLSEAKEGTADAQQKIWEHFYKRLIGFARTKLREGSKRMADEDDVVTDAFNAFFSGVQEGRFPKLNDRHDLWQILVMLTARKSADLMRAQLRQKRGAGEVRGESIFLKVSSSAETVELPSFENIAGDDLSAGFALEVADNFERLLSMLPDETLRDIALWKMEGLLNDEIAAKIGTTCRTVERKLNLIRQYWAGES